VYPDFSQDHDAITDAACEDDKDWFDAHPKELERLRQVIPGEIPEEILVKHGAQQLAKVTRIGPNVRCRLFFPGFLGSLDVDD
jgi:hypothetical protein